MKTIEQILEERYPIQEQESYDNYLFRLQRGGFNHGIEVAEEWIKVEDELPEVTPYLGKDKSGRIELFKIADKSFLKALGIVEWRPLHRK